MATSIEAYDAAFEAERKQEYPIVDELEKRLGFAVERKQLEGAARVLACPVKVNPPNWQHGRVIYATLLEYLARCEPWQDEPLVLDIGTAKGFSALCMQWALLDWVMGAELYGRVVSVDVISPLARVPRNTVAEVNGPLTLEETLAPYPEADYIHFEQATGVSWLSHATHRVNFAFVDGKHNYATVAKEAAILNELQQADDVIVFDDAHIPGVAQAISDSLSGYVLDRIDLIPDKRAYVIARKR